MLEARPIAAVEADGSRYAGRVTVEASQSGLHTARCRIRAIASKLNFSATQSLDLQIAAGEALSNAFRHGSPNAPDSCIHVSWTFADNVLTITVADEGAGISPRKTAGCGAPGGYGISLMKGCADEVDFHFGPGSRVELRKRA